MSLSLPRRLRAGGGWRSPALLAVLVVNVVLLALYLWSRGGSTVHVRIEMSDARYRAFVDGQLIAETEVRSGGSGAIGIALPPASVPSLPGPSGIDSLRVTDATTGDVVLDEDFDGDLTANWPSVPRGWDEDSGVYTASDTRPLATDMLAWGDYVVDLKLKNPRVVSVNLSRQEGDSVVILFWPFGAYKSLVAVVRDGTIVDTLMGPQPDLDREETLRSMTAMLLRPYPLALALIAATIAIALLVTVRIDARLRAMAQSIAGKLDAAALIMAAGAFVLLLYIIYSFYDAMPHVPDSFAYVFQAKIFASFRLTADPPPAESSFQFFVNPFMHVVDGDWFSQYPFGHPLVLAIGERLGAVWLVPPALGALSVYLLFRLGKHVYGSVAGFLAALLLLFSPFFLMTGSNFMSHNTTAFALLACLVLLVRGGHRRDLSMFAAGLFLGLAFNIRPLVVAAFVPVLGAFMAYELWRAGQRRRALLGEDIAFAAGGLVMLLAYFGYNQVTTGVFTDSPQTLTLGETSGWLGFGGNHTFAAGLRNQQQQLALLVLVANGWPAAIGLLFAGLPFLLLTRNRWDYVLGAFVVSLTAVNVLYLRPSIMHGPRFWYEATPFLMLLSARGAVILIDRAAQAAGWLATQLRWQRDAVDRSIAGIAVYGLIVGLIASSAHGFMLGKRDLWAGIDFTPQRMELLGKTFNNVDRRLLDRADEMDLRNALVFVAPCELDGFWCYGSVFWANTPGLDGDVVWAKQTKTEADLVLLEHYRGRSLYLANFTLGHIRPTTVEELQRPVEETDPALRATQAVSAAVTDAR